MNSGTENNFGLTYLLMQTFFALVVSVIVGLVTLVAQSAVMLIGMRTVETEQPAPISGNAHALHCALCQRRAA